MHDYKQFFPYPEIREQQALAIEFALKAFDEGKRFVILELGTGCGKSAIGITVARYLESTREPEEEPAFRPGAYVLTTQKILQQQYMNDFGSPKGPMLSIKSSENFQCEFFTQSKCSESLRLLKAERKGSPFWNQCMLNCCYKNEKKAFIEGNEGITNFSYFLAETMYGGQLKPRELLIVDEAHNTEGELSKFVEVSVSERFARDILKLEWPTIKSQNGIMKWIRDEYRTKLRAHIDHIEGMLEKLKVDKEKEEFLGIMKNHELLDKHICKVNRFLGMYSEDNWVMDIVEADGRSLRKAEFKPVDVGPYAEELLFRLGRRVVMMSATIVNRQVFCETLGIPSDQVAFLSVDSPFPIENRPIHYIPVGSMAKDQLDETLPRLAEAIKVILDEHKKEKGIIHCHTYKIASYIKKHIRSKRLITHTSEDREEKIREHMSSDRPTVLLSPSLSEGIDLKDDLSRFQVVCKVPFPYLGDKLVRKRMNKRPKWYPYQTAKTVVQAVGRSIRNEADHAVTYILDDNWERFFRSNADMFPESFRNALHEK